MRGGGSAADAGVVYRTAQSAGGGGGYLPLAARSGGGLHCPRRAVYYKKGDEYDYDEEESQSAQAQNGVYVILAKNRNGPAGENVLLYWNGEYTKFSSPSDREEM